MRLFMSHTSAADGFVPPDSSFVTSLLKQIGRLWNSRKYRPNGNPKEVMFGSELACEHLLLLYYYSILCYRCLQYL